jgi:hypothetical protein
MPDPTAALAEALAEYKAGIIGTFSIPQSAALRWQDRTPEDRQSWIAGAMDDAAAILAALPDEWGWREGYAENMNRLLNANLDYGAEIDRQQAEIARLRAIEEAARAVVDGSQPTPDAAGIGSVNMGYLMAAIAALRAALGEDR